MPWKKAAHMVVCVLHYEVVNTHTLPNQLLCRENCKK